MHHAHKMLITKLSLTNYCQEVFRPRLKCPEWAFFPGWALAHLASLPVPAPLRIIAPKFTSVVDMASAVAMGAPQTTATTTQFYNHTSFASLLGL